MAGALALGLATLSGCGIGTPSTISESTPMATFNGKVHGGQQPVTGSLIQLWTVGTTGYGSAGTNLLGTNVVTTSLTDGSFNITGDYTCPTANTLVYITATGGNPGMTAGTNNLALKLAAPLGPCGNLNSSTFIVIDEVTTAAAAIALGQYFTPTLGASSTDTFGAPNTTQAQVGIANAFATVNSLVNTASGNAVTSTTLTGPAGTITATPESAKLNTIADILAACVNSDGLVTSPCQTTLFPDVTPTGGTAPTDTLQAAVYMSLNPTSNNANGSAVNLTALYGLQTAQSPFVGAASQPTDWTVGIQYAGTAATTNTLINDVLDIRADASGNIWFINGSGTALSEAMTELSPTGVPLVNAFAGSTSPTGMQSSTPRNLAIDLNGNAWATSSSGSSTVYQYNPNTSSGTSLNVGGQGYGIAVDGSNNVFIGHNSTSATTSLDQFTAGVLAATNRISYPLDGGSASNDLATYSVVDTLGNVWHSTGTAATTSVIQVSGMNGVATCTTFPCTATNDASLTATYTPVSGGSILGPFSMAAGANSVWVANSASGANSITKLALTGGTGTNFGSSTSLNSPHYIAVDGSGNVWVSNKTTTPGSVSEFTDAGAILSPVSGTTPFNVVGFSHAGIATAEGITIDPSGNVWVANNAGTAANSIFEIVGAASPTVTPIALALKNNTVGQKP